VYIFLLYAIIVIVQEKCVQIQEWVINMAQNLDEKNSVNVSIAVGDIRVEFNGSPESVVRSAIGFLAKQIPAIDLARKISLDYAVTELIDIYSSLIKITPEGPRVIPQLGDAAEGKKLSDKEMVMLQLVASKIAKDLGKVQNDGMQLSEIYNATSINPRSVSSRLSELVKAGYVLKENPKEDIDNVIYKITTQGIHWLNSVIAKKLR
jgi:DNA-binding MarR family transcriptional regulator